MDLEQVDAVDAEPGQGVLARRPQVRRAAVSYTHLTLPTSDLV